MNCKNTIVLLHYCIPKEFWDLSLHIQCTVLCHVHCTCIDITQGVPYSTDMCPCYTCFYPDVPCAPPGSFEHCNKGTCTYNINLQYMYNGRVNVVITTCTSVYGDTQYTYMYVYAAMVDCPVFENDVIVQQPADLLTLTEDYVSAASSFIKTNAGTLHCTSVLYRTVCVWLF